MLVVGDKEEAENKVGVRDRKQGDLGAIDVNEFVLEIDEEIRTFAK